MRRDFFFWNKSRGNDENSGKKSLRAPPNEGLDEMGITFKGIKIWILASQRIMSPRFLKQFVTIAQEIFHGTEKILEPFISR